MEIMLIFKFLFLMVPILLSIAFITLLERKMLSIIGLRLGPNKVHFLGVLQPISDAIKLSNKQINKLNNYSFVFYYLTSISMIILSLTIWSILIENPKFLVIKFNILMLLVILGLNTLMMIISGWSTFSKFSLIGSIRTMAQLISYESALYLCLFFFFLMFFSFSLMGISFKPIFSMFLIKPFLGYCWIPCLMAELNRTPFDFSEGESELVSGFNTEFSGYSFTMIFLAEYSNIIFFSLISSILLFLNFSMYMFIMFMIFIIWIRSVLPRFRFDKLMYLAWKFFIPFLTFMFILEMLMDF